MHYNPCLALQPPAPLARRCDHRYVANLDGVSYSLRLSRIMHTNSVLIKEETREWVLEGWGAVGRLAVRNGR